MRLSKSIRRIRNTRFSKELWFSLKIVIIYILIGILYIVLSDAALFRIVSVDLFFRFNILMDSFFVIVTALILHSYIYHSLITLRNSEKELKATKETLESFINHTTDPIIMVDLQGTILKVNKAFEQMFGWAAEEIVGRVSPLVHDELRDEEQKLRQIVSSGGQVTGYETIKKRKDGSQVDVSETFSPVRDAAGNIYAFANIIRDITERKRVMEEERKRAEEALKDAEKLKYIYMERERLARDLHDTVAQDIAYANMQLKFITKRVGVIDTAELRKSLHAIYTVLEQGFSELRQTLYNMNHVADLGTFLRDTLDLFEKRTGIATNLQLEGLPDNLDVHFITQVSRIIQETLNNIRKHANATWVDIRIIYTKTQLQIQISDNGCGFDVNGVDNNRHFGLRSIRERCQEIKGNAEVNSIVDKGTQWTFVFNLDHSILNQFLLCEK
ncbi:PAS domain S-box protein [Paenibacillus albiflavus]|uniref:histidine kinase n=1 Tax=Paenibacillus albiflavus TaxID=2545760 RepID=A0A4R4E8K2_9BACL|nr:PAS domain S-box protein [Paenibacillus albiflavus]TCZ75487.1 PAS domain S-box protein [Paenibacillus albiflavus]